MLILCGDTVFRCEGEAGPVEFMARDGSLRVAEGGVESAIATEDGCVVLLSNADGDSIEFFTGIEDPIFSMLILDEDPIEMLLGTEGAHLYHMRGEKVERIETFDALECRKDWYTPWGGPPTVRSMARTSDGWIYADIHVGSIMRSADRGATWEPVTPTFNEDVHRVATCPADDERVYADTARAVFVSYDRGRSWEDRGKDLGNRYGRCITVHPEDPDLILATVSDGPHGDNVHGQLWRSEDAGRNWTHVADPFPANTRDNIDTYHVAFDTAGTAWAVVDDRLYIGRDRANRWELVWTAPEDVDMLACRRPDDGA